MVRFRCRGVLVKPEAEGTGAATRLGCGQSLDAVIEAAERAVHAGKATPGLQTLTCPCEMKRKFTIFVDAPGKA